jgi:hypothetical protein
MPRVDYSNTNNLWKQLLGIQTQKMMGDLSLERQLEYMKQSNAFQGERESQRIKEAGEKEKDVAGYKHGLDLDKLAQENTYWMAKQPGVKRLMNMYQTTQDPAIRTQIEGALDKFSTLFGTTAEKSMKGGIPTADEIGALSTFVDPKEAITYFNGISANVRGVKTAGIQQQQADTQRMRAVDAREGGGREKAGKAGKDLNDEIAAKAKEAMKYLEGGTKTGQSLTAAMSEEGPAADKSAPLRRALSHIRSMASRKKFTDPAWSKTYFDFIDAVYESPEAAMAMVSDIEAANQTRSTVSLGQAKRKKTIPPGTPTATNPETGEVLALIGGRWVPIE